MKTVGRTLCIILAICMQITLIAVPVFAEEENSPEPTTQPIIAAFDFVNDASNALAKLQGGNAESASWDSNTQTLTLNGINVSFSGVDNEGILLPGGSNIVLAPNTSNYITNTHDTDENGDYIYAIDSTGGGLTVTGSGSLKIEGVGGGSQVGFFVEGDLVFDNTNVDINLSNEAGGVVGCSTMKTIVKNNSYLNIKLDGKTQAYGIFSYDINIENSDVTIYATSPEDAIGLYSYDATTTITDSKMLLYGDSYAIYAGKEIVVENENVEGSAGINYETDNVAEIATAKEDGSGKTYKILDGFSQAGEIVRLIEMNKKVPGISTNPMEYWVDKGVFSGDDDGSMREDSEITRAELAKVLILATGKSTDVDSMNITFTDVSDSDWFAPYVKAAVAYGIMDKNENGSFDPYGTYMSIGDAADCFNISFGKSGADSNIGDRLTRINAARLMLLCENSNKWYGMVDSKIEKSQPSNHIFKTVSDAVEAAPSFATENTSSVISITPGVYREYIVIDKPYINLTNRKPYNTEPVKLTYYYGASRSYKSFDALTENMEYPSIEKFENEKEYLDALKLYESKKTLKDGKAYVKSSGYVSGVGTQNSASVTVTEKAVGFSAKHITFENSYNLYMTDEEKSDIYEPNNENDLLISGNLDEKARNKDWFLSAKARATDVTVDTDKTAQAQAVALRCSADKALFDDCTFIGRQDTLYVKDGARIGFWGCDIEGTVDFIFGDANALFAFCNINSVMYPNGGYITAGSHAAAQTHGFLFYCCKLTGDEGLSQLENAQKVKLGRPWKQDALVVYYKCYMGDHIATGDDRWADMSGNTRDKARFAEANTMDSDGNAFDSSVYASYETVFDYSKNWFNFNNYGNAFYDKTTGQMQEPDGWRPFMFRVYDGPEDNNFNYNDPDFAGDLDDIIFK